MMDDKKTFEPTTPELRGSLEAYLNEVSEHQVMSRDEELAEAVRIASCRRDYWRSLLAYPPYVEAITQVIERALADTNVEPGMLEEARTAARNFRDRQTRKHRDAYDSTVERMSQTMVYADPDCEAADLIAADLELLDAGCAEGVNMDVRLPPRGSKPFGDYVQHVRSQAAALRRARNKFVRANLRLVLTMAHRYNHGLLPLPDLIQEGNLGLLKAVDRFDHRKGFRFSTYATWWIRHAISRATANRGRTVRVPAHMASQFHQLRKARRKLEAELGRTPTLRELASELELTPEKVERIQTALRGRPISLNAPVGSEDGDTRSMLDILPDADSDAVSEHLESQSEHELLQRAMENLSPLEIDILRKRFGLEEDGRELTLKEVGNHHSLSRERIRQLQERAMTKLRAELARLEARHDGPRPLEG